MSDVFFVPTGVSTGAPVGRNRVRVITPILLALSMIYAAATFFLLPGIGDIESAIEVFLSGAVPGLIVTMLLWAARPTVYGPRCRSALVGVILLAATLMSVLPSLVAWARA